MFTKGRICLKTAGRDASKYCAIIEVLENGYVTIDGETRKRKCNVNHLEPTKKTIDVKGSEASNDIVKLIAKEGFKVTERKIGTKDKKEKTPRPTKAKVVKEKKPVKKTPKKAEKVSKPKTEKKD